MPSGKRKKVKNRGGEPRTVRVRSTGGNYPAVIGSGSLSRLPLLLEGKRRPSRLHLVSDRNVLRHHGEAIRKQLRRTGIPFSETVLAPGEGSKTMEQMQRILRSAVRSGCDRNSCMIAFGGGVVGDITGYAAASLLRGVEFIQVPASLLAMVDASVGGKTGVNIPEGKNLAGAFHQPRAVIMDLDLLGTLPVRQARAGWAEIIKTAAIRDLRLLSLIEREREVLLAGSPPLLAKVVERCVRIKAEVVEEDERESGLRMILNFGHTLAHGIEAAQGYGSLLHGEAVAVGMVFAARLGERLGITREATADRLEALLAAFGLPVYLSKLSCSRILTAMGRDKKRGPRGLRWVFLSRPGEALVRDDVKPAAWQAELKKFIQGK